MVFKLSSTVLSSVTSACFCHSRSQIW